MTTGLLTALAALWLALIWFWGTGRFGRAQTQRWIDWVARHPRLAGLAPWLNRRHGTLRAAWHYVEFGTLCWLAIALATAGAFRFDSWRPYAAWLATCLIAWVDEAHQARTPGRMFRRVDFLHSLLGATLMLAGLFLYDLLAHP